MDVIVQMERAEPQQEQTFVLRLRFPHQVLGTNFLSSERIAINSGILAKIDRPFRVQVVTRVDFPRMPTVKVFFNPSKLLEDGVTVTEMKLELLTIHGATVGDYTLQPTSEGEITTMSAPIVVNSRAVLDSVIELKIQISASRASTYSQIAAAEHSLSSSEALIGTKFTDMSGYFMNPKLSDVAIKCGAANFPAHILILSLHSPVFEAMFSSDTKENNEKSVSINDVEADVMLEMLRFCYSEKVENLDKIGMELYELADRYLIDSLKVLCGKYLTEHVEVKNVVELFSFARQHRIQGLSEKVKEVLIKNRKELFKDVAEFKTFVDSVPEIAFEIFGLQ